jgi:hypothetical protein
MKLALCLALASLASCAAVSQDVPPRDPTIHRDNHIALYLGQRNLDEDDWEPVEEQPMFGIEYAREPYNSAVGFEIGIMGSSDDDEVGGIDFEGRTGELYGGIKKTFGEDVVRPHLGMGLSVINAEGEVAGFDDDDSAIGVYAHGGIAFFPSESFFVGLDLRILYGGDLELGGSDVEPNYGQLALILGFGF